MVDNVDIWKTCALCLEKLLVGTAIPSECLEMLYEETNTTENDMVNDRNNGCTQDKGKDIVLENLGYWL